ncbi:MAG: uncharacterized protein JWM62_1106 [Frankiales bacterium]|nr:uncharacterized protein [Frankiales bacterium]
MTSVSSRPVARLSSPGDLVATVPSLCGFVPQDSLVLLSLRGARRRLGLTIRLDLPPAALQPEVVPALVDRVVQDGGSAAVLVLYADAPDPALASRVQSACEAAGVRVVESLHVSGDHWTSYLCSGPCCPEGGTPVGEAPALVRAEHALDGRAVLGSREDLVRALAPPAAPVDVTGARAWWAAARRDDVLALAREALDDREVPAATAAALAVALHDVQVRDEVATWALDRSDALLALVEQVVRQVGAPWDAPACTLLAWVAYARGDGARANVALERALRSDPQHPLALLLQAALEGAVPPAEVRRLLLETARALRR